MHSIMTIYPSNVHNGPTDSLLRLSYPVKGADIILKQFPQFPIDGVDRRLHALGYLLHLDLGHQQQQLIGFARAKYALS